MRGSQSSWKPCIRLRKPGNWPFSFVSLRNCRFELTDGCNMSSASLYQTDEHTQSALQESIFIETKKITITILVTTFWEAESVSLQTAEPSVWKSTNAFIKHRQRVVNSGPARRLGDAGEVWKPTLRASKVGLSCISPKIPHMWFLIITTDPFKTLIKGHWVRWQHNRSLLRT